MAKIQKIDIANDGKLELYQIELAKTNFQANVSSLLEIHSLLSQKAAYAKGQGKKFISNNIAETAKYGHLWAHSNFDNL